MLMVARHTPLILPVLASPLKEVIADHPADGDEPIRLSFDEGAYQGPLVSMLSQSDLERTYINTIENSMLPTIRIVVSTCVCVGSK